VTRRVCAPLHDGFDGEPDTLGTRIAGKMRRWFDEL